MFSSLIDLAWFQGRFINSKTGKSGFVFTLGPPGGGPPGDHPGDPPADPLGWPWGDPQVWIFLQSGGIPGERILGVTRGDLRMCAWISGSEPQDHREKTQDTPMRAPCQVLLPSSTPAFIIRKLLIRDLDSESVGFLRIFPDFKFQNAFLKGSPKNVLFNTTKKWS